MSVLADALAAAQTRAVAAIGKALVAGRIDQEQADLELVQAGCSDETDRAALLAALALVAKHGAQPPAEPRPTVDRSKLTDAQAAFIEHSRHKAHRGSASRQKRAPQLVTTTKRPGGRSVGAARGRDLSRFLHDRNSDHRLGVEGEFIDDEVGALPSALDDVRSIGLVTGEADEGFALRLGREAVVVQTSLAADVVHALHLLPPCSRNRDKHIFPLEVVEVNG